MKSTFKRLMAWSLCLVLCAGLLPMPSMAVDAADTVSQQHYDAYETLATVANQGDCYGMQGMTMDSTYTYCAKINGTDNSCAIIRNNKSTGAKTVMTNGTTGSYYFTNLGHANCLDTEWFDSANQMLVTAGATLVRLKLSGTTLTTAGTYTASYNGASVNMDAVQIMNGADQEVKVLVKIGRTLYTGAFDPVATSADIKLTKLCTLNISSVRIDGQLYDLSSYAQQGMDYHDGKLFLPLSGGDAHADTSVVLVYDLEGASGELKCDPTLSFRVISSTYASLFEIQDVSVCTHTGRLYFCTNRRKSDTDSNYDSCSYFTGYTYDPSRNATAPGNYRWEIADNELTSVTDGGFTFNKATQFVGHISGNEITSGLFSLSRSIMLKHDSPWVVEWKSSGSFYGGSLLLATARIRNVANAPYLYRAQDNKLIGIGYYSGSQYNNYGIKLSDHGIDSTVMHTYRLTNKVSSNGSNMVYLSVDGKELGAMNNYFVGSVAQGTTSNWLSGKDFTFSYFGAYLHPVNDCKLEYLQVWAEGEPSKAKQYRWTTTGDNLTATVGNNTATVYNGAVSGSTYTSAAFRLDAPVRLLHDQPWSLEWESQGAITADARLLSAAEGGQNKDAPYLYRSADEVIAFGRYDGTQYANYGIKLSDHGIDVTQKHVYRLTNKIAADGSNMVYLYVDDVSLGAMNNVYNGSIALGTTENWLSGKDLTFDYVGNISYPLNGTYHRLEVWEDGKPCSVEFRDYNGCLLHTDDCKYGEMPTAPADPVRKSDSKYTYTFTGWKPALTEANGEAYYLAAYSSQNRTYTVTFQNYDGSVLKTQTLTYGQMPTAPTDPEKAGDDDHSYTFSGWYPAIGKVTGDAVYTAQFTAGPKQCIITFVDDDGTVLSRQVLLQGEMPTVPAAPVKAATVSHSYTFVGWDSAISEATGDFTYTARYVSALRKYTVQFKNTDGTVLSQQLVPYGYSPTAPSTVPTRKPDSQKHYSFIGWTPVVVNVTADADYTAVYNAVNHNFKTTYTAATCSTPGKTTYTCSCGYSYDETVPAKGHSYRAVVTAPTCTAGGYTTYTCTTCGHSYQDQITNATGHSYSAGRCVTCGAADPNYNPGVTKPTLTLKSPTLEFKDMITVNAFYTAENIQDVVEMGMVTYDEKVTSWSVDTADHVIPGSTYVESSGRYYSCSQGIHAKYLGDTVYLAIYAKLSDGSYAYSKLAGYSAVQYANSQLKGSDAKLKQLVVAMLNYGAEAQLYFGHNTGSLANTALTAAQKALPEAYRSDMVQSVPAASTAKQGVFANNQGFASRKPAISFEGAFCINYFFTPKYAPDSGITLYYWNAEDYNAASVLTASNATGKLKLEGSGTGEYRGDITGIAAKALSEAVYVAAAYKSGGTVWTSGVLGYSIGSYCSSQASKGGTIAGLAQATAVYGYHAKQYFG